MSQLIKNSYLAKEAQTIALPERLQAPERKRDTPSPEKQSNASLTKEKLKALEEKAFEQGLKEGREAAKKELQEKLQELESSFAEEQKTLISEVEEKKSQIEHTLKQLEDHQNSLISELEPNLIKLTLECLYKLAGNKEVYQGIVKNVVENAISDFSNNNPLRIRLPQSDYETLALADSEAVSIIFDASLPAGNCRIESGFSTTEAGIVTLLDQMKDELLKTLSERKTDD